MGRIQEPVGRASREGEQGFLRDAQP
jgi:hypothetical protein